VKKVSIQLERDKETPGTWRYRGENGAISVTAYMQKGQLRGIPAPGTLTVTVEDPAAEDE
jgi:hypothetical protein